MNADDTFEFEEISWKIISTTENSKCIVYFTHHYKPRIELFVYRPCCRTKKTKLWTSSNTESINHMMKIVVNWKLQTTDFVEKLFSIIRLQFIDTRRALYSTGSFRLTDNPSTHIQVKKVKYVYGL